MAALVPLCSVAASFEELELRAQRSVQSAEGRAYEQKASEAFWEAASFMGQCAPSHPASRDPITLYIEVLADGAIGQFEAAPLTDYARCITASRKPVKLPPPPGPFVLKFDLRLKK